MITNFSFFSSFGASTFDNLVSGRFSLLKVSSLLIKNPEICSEIKNTKYRLSNRLSLPSVEQIKNSPFRVSDILVLCGAYWFLGHFEEFLRAAPEQKFGFFLKFLIQFK
jgi:hypothetical protein